MIVGLPGTGIGGLFYLFATLWMPVNELHRLVQGRSSLARWRFIAFNWAMVGGILGTLWLTMLAMKWVLFVTGYEKPKGMLEHSGLAPALAEHTTSFFAAAGWASAMSLVALMVIVHVLRVTAGRGRGPSGAGEMLPAPLAHVRDED